MKIGTIIKAVITAAIILIIATGCGPADDSAGSTDNTSNIESAQEGTTYIQYNEYNEYNDYNDSADSDLYATADYTDEYWLGYEDGCFNGMDDFSSGYEYYDVFYSSTGAYAQGYSDGYYYGYYCY